MELTEFLQLNKPGYENLADIEILNENFEKIDLNAKTSAQNLDTHISQKATQTVDGHMTKVDKAKLDGIATGANNYILPTATAAVLGGIKVGSNLTISNGVLSGMPRHVPSIGEVIFMKSNANPGENYLGTTWQKIEGRMIRATSSGQASGVIGGSDSCTLAVGNLPPHNHAATTTVSPHTHTANHSHTASQTAHTHTQPTHSHTYLGNGSGTAGNRVDASNLQNRQTSSDGGETTGSAEPTITVNTASVTTSSETVTAITTISNAGSGTAFSVLNAYYTLHVWERVA